MIKNVIFDVDGVIRKLNDDPVEDLLPADLLEKYKGRYANLSIKKYFSKFLHNDIFAKYDLGISTQDEMIAQISEYFNEPQEVLKFLLDVRCLKEHNTIFEQTINLVNSLRKNNYNTYILSNMGLEAANVLKVYIDMSKFNDAIFSCDVGFMKPNLDMYTYALKRFGVKAEESVFVDDRQENLTPFKKLGGLTYLFDSNKIDSSVKELEEIITQNGIQFE